MQSNTLKEIKDIILSIYGDNSDYVYNSIKNKINSIKTKRNNFYKISNKDSVLITYADNIYTKNESCLKTLNKFSKEFIGNSINTIHILPFFPYSSDDGFSVIDYKKIDEKNGSWEDIKYLSENYRLMFDAVINHISKENYWFQEFLNGNKIYSKYFIECENDEGLSKVVRPRTHSLLTEFKTSEGIKKIWTTFSEDQVDLNYKNPEVLLEIIDILIFYAEKGAKLLRLDAIGFLWKEKYTTCIHLNQTHLIIKLIRKIFEMTYKDVLIITETNVPHEDNIKYFGNGNNEAHMIYNFTLPPLILYTFFKQDSRVFLKWLKSIKSPSKYATYFNFLASHDGIGLRPLEGIIDDNDKKNLIEDIIRHNGFVSYKKNSDGSKSPYELNINLFSAFKDDDLDLSIRKFISAYAIACFMPGVPGIYIHSLLGSENFFDGVKKTGQYRSINREKLHYENLIIDLKNPKTLRYKIFHKMKKILSIRSNNIDFDPFVSMKVLDIDNETISFERNNSIKFILNISNKVKKYDTDKHFVNLIDEKNIENFVDLKPFEFVVLKK